MDIQILFAFIAYFLLIFIIGLASYTKQHSSKDFIIGNRSLNFWVTALSAHASDMSAWLFMAFPAAIFIGGLSQTWTAVGLILGMYLNWQFIAQKLRIATEKYDSCTLSTFFEKRFSDQSGIIRLITATMSLIFLTCYLSAGLIAMGFLFEPLFNIDYYIGLTVATLVIVIYTFIGGFITAAWTDLFQAIFLLCMIILVPVYAFSQLDNGFFTIEMAALKNKISLHFIENPSFETFLAIIFLILGWGLGYFGQPHIITKFMGIRSANELHKSKYIGMTWQIIALGAATAAGLIGIGFFKDGLDNPELVFVEMVNSLFSPLGAGFILCAILAANMSTMDSQILVCASVISEDFYKHFVSKQAEPAQLLKVSRIGVIIIACVSLAIAFNKNATVLDTVLYAWTGLGCAFGPLVLMSLYSKKANKYGAIAGIVVGGVVAGGWGLINRYVTQYEVPAMIPGFFLSLASIYLVSRIYPCEEKMDINGLNGQRMD